MEWNEIENIKNESERVKAIYNKLDEGRRLNQKKSSWVEYLVIMSFLNKRLNPNDKIIDIGAGVGTYSVPLAEKGYEVTAIDLVENNIEKLKSSIKSGYNINCVVGDAKYLDGFSNEGYDMAMLMGPLYHLCDVNDRLLSIKEALRVIKSGSYLFMTFMNNDVAPFFMLETQPDFFSSNAYNHNDFHVKNHLYVFHTIEEIRKLCDKFDIEICNEVAVDGLSLIYHKEINEMSDLEFDKYIKYHFYMCEKKEYLAASSHILIICRKR